MHALVLHVLDSAAAGPTAPGGFGLDNVKQLMLVVAGLVVIGVGILMAPKAHKGKFKDTADTFGSMFLVFLVIAAGVTLGFLAIGENLLGFLFPGSA